MTLPPFFPPGVVAGMQRMNEDNLPDTAEILIPTVTKAPGGYTSIDYDPVGLAACRVSTFGSSPQETIRGGKIAHPERSWTVVFAVGTEIDEKAHLRVTGAEGWTKRLSVVAVAGPRTYDVLVKIIGEEVPDA